MTKRVGRTGTATDRDAVTSAAEGSREAVSRIRPDLVQVWDASG